MSRQGEHVQKSKQIASTALELCCLSASWLEVLHPSVPMVPVSENSADLVNVANKDKLRERKILPTAMEEESYVLLF